MNTTKKITFYALITIFIILILNFSLPLLFSSKNIEEDDVEGFSIDISLVDENTNFTRLDELYDYREWGGVGKDGIQSINIPNWITVSEVDFMDESDIKFEKINFPTGILFR